MMLRWTGTGDAAVNALVGVDRSSLMLGESTIIRHKALQGVCVVGARTLSTWMSQTS